MSIWKIWTDPTQTNFTAKRFTFKFLTWIFNYLSGQIMWLKVEYFYNKTKTIFATGTNSIVMIYFMRWNVIILLFDFHREFSKCRRAHCPVRSWSISASRLWSTLVLASPSPLPHSSTDDFSLDPSTWNLAVVTGLSLQEQQMASAKLMPLHWPKEVSISYWWVKIRSFQSVVKN